MPDQVVLNRFTGVVVDCRVIQRRHLDGGNFKIQLEQTFQNLLAAGDRMTQLTAGEHGLQMGDGRNLDFIDQTE
ncbi:hypothetical protein D3C86_1480590 [compost metagenome]